MKKRNKGLSLVELVVTIAVMAVLTGGSIYGVNNVPRYWARECSKKITSNLAETKITSLGKATATGDIVWELYKENNKIYVRTLKGCTTSSPVELKPATRIGKGGRSKLYIIDESNYKAEITNGRGIRFCFDRATGAIYTCGGSGNIPAGAALTTLHSSDNFQLKKSAASTCKKIIVSANGREYVTELVPQTGKIVN